MRATTRPVFGATMSIQLREGKEHYIPWNEHTQSTSQRERFKAQAADEQLQTRAGKLAKAASTAAANYVVLC